MELKHYDKPGYLAWSNSKNHSELLASASLHEQNDLYSLDILQIDLQDRSKKLNPVGSAYTDIPFRCIAWDNYGQKQNTYPNGMIFTGMDDGSFRLWNPAEIINNPPQEIPTVDDLDSQTCLVYGEEPEQGAFPIMCCEWNSLKNNFLAFGGTDVLLLNSGKNPSEPQIIKPGKKNPHLNSFVTSVSWNREVAHILASASENGLVALWDIKTNNSIFQFKDSGSSSGNRNVVICWSKSISTQIAVTLDDQKRNQLQIWDLRNQKGPVIVIDKLHTKGINSMDWCETDPELILTGSRDNNLACWNYTQEETPLSSNSIEGGVLTAKWSKKLPSIYATSNEDKTSVYSLSDNLFGYVPKWYKVPVGATLFGSDTALTYSEQRGAVLVESKVNSRGKDPQLQSQLKALSNALSGVFDQRQNDSELTTLIKAQMSNEEDSQIYDYLGLNKEKIVKEVQNYTGKKLNFATGPKSQKQKNSKPKAKAYTSYQGQKAVDFFESFGSKPAEIKQEDDDQDNEGDVKYDMIPRNFNWDQGKERLVKQNILIGNYQGAIDAALKCGRLAEALIIAYSVDQNLFSNTLKTFFTETTDNFITDVLKTIAYRDPVELINKYDLKKWKQCIALIYSMSSREKRPQMLKLLAERLVNETEEGHQEKDCQLIPETFAPIICYVLAQDFGQIAKVYANNLKNFKSGSRQRKKVVVEYTRRLVTIHEGFTIQIPRSKQYDQILRESMFIAIEMGEKVIAHLICTKLPNNSPILDYLVNSTKELQKYKTSVVFKPIVLPVMPKKQQKKPVKEPLHPKQKKGIFPPKEVESRTSLPPPPAHQRRDEEQTGGFSPYDNGPKAPPERPVKKNLNTPPPPPITNKKVIHHPIEEPQQERSYHQKPPPQVTPHKNVKPPPPQPNYSHDLYAQEEPKGPPVVSRPPPRSSQPPPPPQQTEKKMPPQVNQPTRQHPPPPPSMVRQQTQESQQSQHSQSEEVPRHNPPPPKRKGNPPPPPTPTNRVAPESDRQPVKEEAVQPPPRRMPIQTPPTKREVPSQIQKKVEQKQEYEEEEEQHPPRRNPPVVPPPAKRGPPPPPRR